MIQNKIKQCNNERGGAGRVAQDGRFGLHLGFFFTVEPMDTVPPHAK